MSKIITVVGATGIQGGSVVNALLDDAQYSIRAITRNTNSDAAKALTDRGVEVVQADLNDVISLKAAFAGSYAIFAVTNFFEALPTQGVEKAMEIEIRLGSNLADAAAATESLVHYVWSTLPNSRKLSGGKAVVPYYDSKNRIDDHVRSIPALLAKTTFLWIGWYASNMEYPWNKPTQIATEDGSKSYVMLLSAPASVKIPMAGDQRINTGLLAKAIFGQPEKTLGGKIVAGVEGNMTYGEMAHIYGAAQGIKVRTVQISASDFVQLWPTFGGLMHTTNEYMELLDGKAFTSPDEEVLSVKDLGVEGFVTSAKVFGAKKLFD
ncbi:hypothetical protein F5X68DRAFT_178120 [Plectosphaerella plurivora]|uniref:NmrA-like domain-containing protein n=1 Tax=Plectosphaerella plurivora TaxID=936078 RepID=A0A9P8V0Y4_9PEZI|nr:hypothetical protein F5X68DRAFT_178120 [Plectosphaerella plurivora]